MSAERQRRYRRRRRAGLIVIRLAVDSVTIPEALVEIGELSPEDYDDARAIAAALERCEITIRKRVTA